MTRLLRLVSCVLLPGCFLTLAGCARLPVEESPGDPEYAPLSATSPVPDFRNQGGIGYARFGSSLFSDRRAANVGDIITVRLAERTQASKDAGTQITKDQDIQMNEATILGDSVEVRVAQDGVGDEVALGAHAENVFAQCRPPLNRLLLFFRIQIRVVEHAQFELADDRLIAQRLLAGVGSLLQAQQRVIGRVRHSTPAKDSFAIHKTRL